MFQPLYSETASRFFMLNKKSINNAISLMLLVHTVNTMLLTSGSIMLHMIVN